MFFSKEIDKKAIFKYGLGGGLLEIAYVLLVAFIFTNLGKILPTPPEILGFIFMLLLFVFSAAISGFFILGYPLYLCLQKRFKEAGMAFSLSLLTIIAGFAMIILIILVY